MVVSSGFMDHVLAYDRSEVYLRANGLIPPAAQPINNTLNRQQVSEPTVPSTYVHFHGNPNKNNEKRQFCWYIVFAHTDSTATAVAAAATTIATIDKRINYATISQRKVSQ